MADSESGSPVSYLSFLVTIGLFRLVSGIFACDRRTDDQTDRQTDNADRYYSWLHDVAGQLISRLSLRGSSSEIVQR